jgi:hypothetical protein
MIALARGVTLRGTMKYDCAVRVLGATGTETLTVEANDLHDAACNAADKTATAAYNGGQRSFVSPQSSNVYLACIGQQEPCDSGIVTRGHTLLITVEAHEAPK